MHILNGGIAQKPDSDKLALEVVKHRVLGKPYSAWRAIIAEMGQSDTEFLIALKLHFDIEIPRNGDPVLFVVQDTQQMRYLAESGVPNPTMLQILLTSRMIGLDEQDASAKFIAWLKRESAEPEIVTS